MQIRAPDNDGSDIDDDLSVSESVFDHQCFQKKITSAQSSYPELESNEALSSIIQNMTTEQVYETADTSIDRSLNAQ